MCTSNAPRMLEWAISRAVNQDRIATTHLDVPEIGISETFVELKRTEDGDQDIMLGILTYDDSICCASKAAQRNALHKMQVAVTAAER